MIPNLDAMTQDELTEFWAKTRVITREAAAAMVGDRRKGYTHIPLDAAAYAINKAVAMRLREEGNIERAQVYERICERIYEEFPADLRW